ncbi:MAG: bifunctional enzyme IspD/IspF [Rhodomicrobium sp.]|nr:MAG: bifunctional enzyme IspD/IspF [Rhodomicrobium sp.]
MTCVIDALIVAAGRGLRALRDDITQPKQYVPLNGRAVLAHTIDRFYENPLIRHVQVVIHADDHALFEAISKNYSDKLLPPVIGGSDRQNSVMNGLKSIGLNKPDFVMIHDGVRPFVSDDLLERIAAGHKTQACLLPVLAVTDTLKRVSGDLVEETLVEETVDRAGLYGAQTPQSFNFEMILAAHNAAADAVSAGTAPAFTDDASIAEWHGLEVTAIAGESQNIKITTPDDFDQGEWILSQMLATGTAPFKACSQTEKSTEGKVGAMIDIRVGQGFDVHAFEPGDQVILCGLPIPHNFKLKGHSDADVGMHALTDALYGAIGAGDIGTHFPPSDEQWRGAASDIFLKAAAEAVRGSGGVITHVDVTLICEAPKIGPHAADMKAILAGLLNIAEHRVSVKATTSERLGFTGRGEGIAALASATVVFPE